MAAARSSAGTSDVDLLDRLFPRHPGARDGVFEGVEVDADEIEGRDAMLLEIVDVLGDVASGEDACMDRRVEGDDAVPEQLSESREVSTGVTASPASAEESGGATAREELDVEPVEPFRERGQPRLVATERSARRHEAISSTDDLGSRRCSTFADARVQRLDGVVREYRHRLLTEHAAGVDPFVDEMDRGAGLLDPGGERVLDSVQRRETRAAALDGR